MFKTTCPKCKAKDQLIVVFFEDATGKPRYPDAPLEKDGFYAGLPERFYEKHGGDTDRELVQCEACQAEFPLSEVTE